MNQPSRTLLIVSGVLTQVVGAACLILNAASLPFAHDLHARTHSIVASIIAALATVICGTLVYRGRLIPLALAAGLDLGFGIGLPRGSAAVGALLHVLPSGDAATASTLVTIAAVVMFIAAILCVLAIPTALRLRTWARGELEREARAARGAEGERAKRASTGAIIPASASTLKGVGPEVLPTQVLHLSRKGKPYVIVGVAVALIALGIVVISAASSSNDAGSSAASGSASARAASGSSGASAATVDAGALAAMGDAAPVPPADPPVDEISARLHLALEHVAPAELALLFDSHAFAFGVGAHDVAQGRDAVVALLRRDLGTPPRKGFTVSTKFARAGHDGDVGWIAEELEVGGETFVTTAVVGLRDGAWTIAALHWAQAVRNEDAYRLARDGQLEVPDAIPDTHDESPLGQAMRTGFASRPSFVAARSTRPDAVNFGSAPGERVLGGDTIRKVFGRLQATLHLHDAVAVGLVGAHGGWGAANVDFTDADKDGTEVTQTFRVLVAWLEEPDGWRMVQSQWSNPR